MMNPNRDISVNDQMACFNFDVYKLFLLIQCYKAYPSPWLKNTTVIYRNKDGTFTDKSQLLDFDKDVTPKLMDSKEYGNELSQVSEAMQKNKTVLTGDSKSNFNELLATQGNEFFSSVKEMFKDLPQTLQDTTDDLINNLDTNLKNNKKSFVSIADEMVASLQQSPTISLNPMENLSIGVPIFTGLDTLGRLVEQLGEDILSNLDIQEWSIGASLNSMKESLMQLLKDSTNLETQNKIPTPLTPLVSLAHDLLVSDEEKRQEILDIFNKNPEGKISDFLPKNKFVDKLSEVGIEDSKNFLETQEQFQDKDLDLMVLMDHAVREKNQVVPLTKRIKQFKEGDKLEEDLTWLEDYLKAEQKYGDVVLDSAEANSKQKLKESYDNLIKDLKSNTNGQMKLVDPKRSLTKKINGKKQSMSDESVKEFIVNLLGVQFAYKRYPDFKETVNAGKDINPEVKSWLEEISDLVDIDTKFLPTTVGEMGQDYVLNQKWINEMNMAGSRDRREDNPLEEDITEFNVDVPVMAIFAETFILGDYMEEDKSIARLSKRQVKRDTFHEYGHVVENMDDSIHKKAKDFLFERNNGDIIDHLAEGNGLQIDGDFTDSYTGRLYLNLDLQEKIALQYNAGKLDINNLNIKKSDILDKCTEVISTGTERLSDPYHLQEEASRDKDHLMFVLSLIGGLN